MINHARTLLLNLSADNDNYEEEYIDPNFKPIKLSKFLSNVYRIIFSDSDIRKLKLYRTAQVMTFLHCESLKKYILDLDTRITYLTNSNKFYYDEPKNLIPWNQLLDKLLPLAEKYPDELLTNYKNFDLDFSPFIEINKGYISKLGGILLGYIYKVEDLRNGQSDSSLEKY